ncbi:MAG: hypothetical protein K8T89_18860 [Planctomycetes bacterium]|nr:hypothetical protein [Planctomycetota bacterium]
MDVRYDTGGAGRYGLVAIRQRRATIKPKFRWSNRRYDIANGNHWSFALLNVGKPIGLRKGLGCIGDFTKSFEAIAA